MNFKRKWLLFVLPPVVLSATLFGVKWKGDNPMPTPRDLVFRREIVRGGAFFYFRKKQFVHHLTTQERSEIGEHLNIFWKQTGVGAGSSSEETILLSWKEADSDAWRRVYIGPVERMDYYDDNFRGPPLHPATSRFLRRWLNEHPDILNAKH